MTKTASRQRKCNVFFRNEKKFTENFPGDIEHDRLRDRFFSSLTEVFQPQKNICWEESEITKPQKKPTLPARRHSWSSGSGSRVNISDSHRQHTNSNRKLSQESRKSSTASIPEKIEECSSDDEHLEEESYQICKNTGLRCGNCFQIDSSVKAGTKQNDKNLYCKRCTDLFNSKHGNLHLVHYPVNIHDLRQNLNIETPHSRRMRKSSLPETNDLPSIVEPKYDEETNDTEEMQMIVEKEVNKLLNFNKGTNYHRNRRRNSDHDLKLLLDFDKMVAH